MATGRIFLVMAATAVAAGACARDSVLQSLPACFDVHLGEWSPPLDWGMDSIAAALPSRVWMDTTIVRETPEPSRRLEVAPGALPSPHGSMRWWTQGDSVFMGWGTSHNTGVFAVLRPSGGGLQGTANAYHDNRNGLPEAHLRLRRVSCE